MITQTDFYKLPEVQKQIERQKRNPYGSYDHFNAHEELVRIAIANGVGDKFKDEY